MNIVLNDIEYPLATNLRVAYLVQNRNNHKPYSEVFQSMGDMVLEDQISIIHCSFVVANPEAKDMWPLQRFMDYCLDNMNLKDLLKTLEALVKGIMGEDNDATIADAHTEGGENGVTPQ